MVHNGIEYGLMAAYAEGLNILHRANAGTEQWAGDAETAPLPDREYYRCSIDVAAVAEVWRRGSVVASWLLDLTADALAGLPDRSAFSGRVSDSGEGRWTVRAAVDVGAPANVLSAAYSNASPRAAKPISPTSCSRRCASSSAATPRSRPHPLGERHAAGRNLRTLDPVATRISLVSCGGKSPCSTTPGVSESRAMSWSGSSTRPR